MTAFAAIFLAALSSADAIATLLNSPDSSSPTRYAEAQKIVTREAAEGKPLQQFVLGLISKDEKERKRNLDISRERIQNLAVEKDNSLAWYLLARETNNFKLLKKAADGGNVQALNEYGRFLLQALVDSSSTENTSGSTNTVNTVFTRSFECFKRAAAQRDANAFINLGTCYMRGFGCPVNLELAHQSFVTAAKMGHPEAMDYVSADYEHGVGVPKNESLAITWRMKAKAVRGDEAAAEWLRSGEVKK